MKNDDWRNRSPYLWFAWYPVPLGALASGRLVWLRTVLRVPSAPDIYQPAEMAD
jgi:hypothetical protein